MKTIRQLISFVLGVAVGVCLYSFLRLRPLSPAHLSNASSATRANQSLRPPWVQRSLLPPPAAAAPVRVRSAKHPQAMTHEVAAGQSRVQPKPGIVRAARPAAAKEVAALTAAPAPPVPAVFKTIGYVEKAGGQLEAVILQDNQVQVVHIGDLIAGRFRVTKVSPDSVDAMDETQVPLPMAKPSAAKSNEMTAGVTPQPSAIPAATDSAQGEVPVMAAKSDQPAGIPSAESVFASPVVAAQARPSPAIDPARDDRNAPPQDTQAAADSLGYVQRADGRVETVVADGDTVRLVPETSAATLAQVAPTPHPHEGAALAQVSSVPAATPSAIGGATLGSSADADGHSAAPLASVIHQVSYQVSPPPSSGANGSSPDRVAVDSTDDAVGAAGSASGADPSSIAQRPGGSLVGTARVSVSIKPLGFVEKADGEFYAILSEDDEICLVRQGDRFAGHYRAARVSQDEVGLVEDPPRQAQPYFSTGPPEFSNLLSASVQPAPSLFSKEDCSDCKPEELGEVSAQVPEDPTIEVASPPPWTRDAVRTRSAPARGPRLGSTAAMKNNGTPPDPATFIFQTLGYVESQDGELQAIVADGSQVYLVKQGEAFADQYLATSVDPVLVLAVRVSPGQNTGNSLSAQTESVGNRASKKLYGYLQFPLLGLANVQALRTMDALSRPVLADLGGDLLNSSLPGFEVTFFQGR